jgi:hypothetical protein
MGKLANWKVSVKTGGGSPVTVPNVQGISFTYGRTQPTDDFPTASGTITGILPDSLPTLAKEIGSIVLLQLISTVDNTTVNATYYMKIKELSRTYGTLPNLDTWTMSIIGDISIMSEQQLTSSYSITAGTGTILSAYNLLNSYSILNAIVNNGESVVSGTTFDKGTYISDIVQQLVRTEQGRIVDCVTDTMTLYSRSASVGSREYDYYFGDVPSSGLLPYVSVDFLNDGDYLANTVLVEPDGLAAVSVGTTRPVLSFETLDQTTSQATNLSEYIKQTLNLNTVRPLSITYLYDAQPNPYVIPPPPGYIVWVFLRGVLYKCVVEGATVSGSPAVTQVTLNLSSAESYRFLRLDNPTMGTLDNNRLGF